MTLDLTPSQRALVDAPLDAKIFLRGRAGAGKTSAAVTRSLHLLTSGLPAESMLILTPQRTLQTAYEEAILAAGFAGGQVTFATMGGLARRTCELYWPLVSERAGFKNPDQPPIFLTLETAQYYMAHLVRPKLDEGFFESVTIDRNRLYSQIIDNLNKSAIVGFDYREIADRLSAAWTGDPAHRRVHADAQACATMFREYCLENNLLDFSLQLEIFVNLLWPEPMVRQHLTNTYRHLIYDNVEEDGPRAHDIIREWMPAFDSALLVYDEGAGYRYFLGGDPATGQALSENCGEVVEMNDSFVMSEYVERLSNSLATAITKLPTDGIRGSFDIQDVISARYYPELLDSVVVKIKDLLSAFSLQPSDIVILAPYLSDALRFSITHRLEQAGIPWRSHRPSRSLRDEPASQALLTLAALAHPDWRVHPTRFDAAYAFMFALGTDLIRAQLLAEIVYRPKDLRLSSFEEIKPEMQERITYSAGNRYTIIREWINEYRSSNSLPLDHFLRKLFGEILSQPDFGFNANLDAVRVAASLIESIQKFRNALEPIADNSTRRDPNIEYSNSEQPNIASLGREYLAMLQDGVIAAQYLESWKSESDDAVLVAPAHTFLMMNRPVTVQFWLDPGSNGWVERLAQPLTQPYILSRNWDPSRTWTDADEVSAQTESLARLVRGLLSRCREKIYLAIADLGETGFEQRGTLLRAFQKVITQSEEGN
jgi:superfamily I DNA/RNA helicase